MNNNIILIHIKRFVKNSLTTDIPFLAISIFSLVISISFLALIGLSTVPVEPNPFDEILIFNISIISIRVIFPHIIAYLCELGPYRDNSSQFEST